MVHLDKACPLFPSSDIPATLEFYRRGLGFAVSLEMANYVIIERDGVEVHFWPCDDHYIAENTSAYIRVDDVDSLYKELINQGHEMRIIAPEDREWACVSSMCGIPTEICSSSDITYLRMNRG